MRLDAVLHNLQIMAESTKKLPVDIKEKYPEIRWRCIVGFRNIVVHEYLEGIDNEIIWKIICNELSPLKKAMIEERKNY